MKVGERYIIEISDVIATNDGNIAKIKGFNALVFDVNGLNKLEQIPNGTKLLTPADLELIKVTERREGYEQGFKDGVKHQESMVLPKAEPHEPKEGDVYLDGLGQAFMIFNVKKTKCKEMYSDGSGGEIEIEDLKTRKHVGNIKADLEALEKAVESYE